MKRKVLADIRQNFDFEVSNTRRHLRGFDDLSMVVSIDDPNLSPMDTRNFNHPSSVRMGVARGWLEKAGTVGGVRFYSLTPAGMVAIKEIGELSDIAARQS